MKNKNYSPKIIQMLNYLRFGGAENVVFNYATVFFEMELKNYVAGISKNEKYTKKIGDYSNILAAKNYFDYFLKLWEITDKNSILFANSTIALFFGTALKVIKKNKLIYVQHLYSFSKTKRKLIYFLVNLFADKFVAVSPKIAEVAKKEIKPSKIFFFWNFFNENKVDKEQINLPKNKKDFFIIAVSGTFRKGKNFEMLPEICHNLLKREKNSKILFLVLGDGLLKPIVESKVKKYCLEEHFLFTGYVGNVINYIKEADLYLFLSQAPYEMLSMALIEAMSTGISIMAVENKNNRFILGEKGIYAELNSEDIAKKILEIKNNPNLRKSSKERFKQMFSYKKGREKLEELLLCLY